MSYILDWRDSNETIEFYLDRREGDGYLVLAASKSPEQHIATVFHLGETLLGIIWRGLASSRTDAWKADQQRMIAAAITRKAPVECDECGRPTTHNAVGLPDVHG